MIYVDAAENYKYREEHHSNAEFPPLTKTTEADVSKCVYYGSDGFHDHVAWGYLSLAEAASASEYQPAEYREHIEPFQAVSTAEAVRRFSYY